MANGRMIEVAKATVTLVPNMSGSQAEITSQLTGVANTAAESAGESSGGTFSTKFAAAIKTGAAVITTAVAAATTAAVATGKAFIDAAEDVAAYGDEVDKTSQKLGISAQAYQEWDYVMQIAGTDMASMQAGFKTLANQIDAANSGSEDALAMFESLGISMEDLSTLSQEDLFGLVITGFQGMEESAERAALANDLLGRSGQTLAPLFNMTAEETAELIEQANEYGMVMDDTAVKASADFTDSMTTLENTIQGVKNSMMSQFLPGLTTVTNGLAAIFAGDESGIGQVKEGLTEVITNVQEFAPQMLLLATSLIESLIAGFAPMLPGLVTAIFTLINSAILTFTTLIPELTPVITTGLQQIGQALFTALPVLLSALITMTQDIVTWLASGDTVKTFADGIIQLVGILATGFADTLPILLPALVNIIGQIADSLTDPDNVNMILESILYIVGAIVIALVEALPEIGGVIVKLTLNIVNQLASWGSQLLTWVIGFVTNIWNQLKTWGSQVVNWVVSFVANVRDQLINWGSQILNRVVSWFTGLISRITGFFDNVKNAFTTLGENIRNGVENVKTKVADFVEDIFDKIAELPANVISIGQNLVEGIWNGINNKISWVKNKIWGMGSQITSAIKSVFGIASPSKLWRDQVGAMLALGIGEGFTDTMDDVEGDILDAASGLTADMSAEVSAYGTAGAAMYDTGETINSGGNVINVYAAEGQDVHAIAEAVALRLEEMTRRKGAVYA